MVEAAADWWKGKQIDRSSDRLVDAATSWWKRWQLMIAVDGSSTPTEGPTIGNERKIT